MSLGGYFPALIENIGEAGSRSSAVRSSFRFVVTELPVERRHAIPPQCAATLTVEDNSGVNPDKSLKPFSRKGLRELSQSARAIFERKFVMEPGNEKQNSAGVGIPASGAERLSLLEAVLFGLKSEISRLSTSEGNTVTLRALAIRKLRCAEHAYSVLLGAAQQLKEPQALNGDSTLLSNLKLWAQTTLCRYRVSLEWTPEELQRMLETKHPEQRAFVSTPGCNGILLDVIPVIECTVLSPDSDSGASQHTNENAVTPSSMPNAAEEKTMDIGAGGLIVSFSVSSCITLYAGVASESEETANITLSQSDESVQLARTIRMSSAPGSPSPLPWFHHLSSILNQNVVAYRPETPKRALLVDLSIE